MIKQFMLGAAVLAGVVGINGVVSAADETFVPGANDQVATNQGTTKISLTGDTTTSSLWENPNGSGDGEKATTDSAGKQAFGLTLMKVPSFDFKTATLTGQTTVKATAEGDPLEVKDVRYDESGYKVYAAASQLVNARKTILPVSTFTLSVADGVESAGGMLSGTKEPAKVLDANGGTHASAKADVSSTTGMIAGYGNLIAQDADGNADGTYDSGKVTAQLELSSPRFKTGDYTGTITYTLQDSDLQ